MLVTVRSVTKRQTRNRRSMVTASGGRRLGPAVASSSSTSRGGSASSRPDLQVALFGKADVYRGGAPDDEPDRRPDRRPHRPHRADLPAEREGGHRHLGDRRLVEQALRRWDGDGIADPVPVEVRRPLRAGRPPRRRSVGIHLPETMGDKEQARRRLAFDELLRVQLVLVLRKRAPRAGSGSASATRSAASWSRRFHDAAPVRADRRPAPHDRRDRGRPGRPPPDAPAAPGRRRRRQDGRGGVGPAGGGAGRPPGRADGADRGAGRAARRLACAALLDGVERARRRHQPLRRPPAARGAAHQPRRPAPSDARCSPGWPTAASTSSSAPTPSSRRAVAFHSLGVVVIDEQHRFGVEQRAALRAKGEDGPRHRARRARDDGHADPAHRGHDGLRRPRRQRARRAARPAARRSRTHWADGAARWRRRCGPTCAPRWPPGTRPTSCAR